MLQSRYHRRQTGFSLLEVLIAFAILALSLGVLLQIFSRAMNNTATSGQYSRAVALAEEKLNSVGIDIPLAEGIYSGEPEQELDWIVHVAPYPLVDWLAEAQTVQVYEVTAVTSWPNPGQPRRVTLRTLRLGESLTTPP
ncbi:prepilin-type N-terminal cleavage/methylation domain-containing protein [Rhodoferax sp. 4810]|uniref:Prepilin-type N-terminal cleavage/methylation domain-containing protein n=1 Tax=Thiospirillum jenense TaxID=1653858 RepID=A0A839HBA7_9GAMM|nr:prepilin-type N-terminal cleavage/methylation domain-containing protein [Thiospirillum jenense]MBB1073523.1 prepilin-type N-terminal cleavage/methylation domain-containing protein [Rhodoferax jenense]MBB1126011.1 prepilin-type N-terminal cleavage/methylation domain-containing protein [Thiospirillum jenense]